MIRQQPPRQSREALLLIAPGQRDQAAQIGVARVVLGQQGEMPAAIDERDLRAEDGLDPRLPRGPIETRRTIQRIVIGQGQRRHLILGGALHQFFRRRHAVEQGVVRVGVQFDVHAAHRRCRSRNQRCCSS